MGKVKVITKVGAKIAKSAIELVAPDFSAEATKLVRDQIEKHQEYIKIPDIASMHIKDAEPIINSYALKFAFVLAEPDPKIVGKRINSVLHTTPKINTSVPPETFVKVYYADKDVMQASEKLLEAKAIKKAEQHEHNKALATKVSTTTKKGVIGALNLTKKVNPSKLFKPRKNSEAEKVLSKMPTTDDGQDTTEITK